MRRAPDTVFKSASPSFKAFPLGGIYDLTSFASQANARETASSVNRPADPASAAGREISSPNGCRPPPNRPWKDPSRPSAVAWITATTRRWCGYRLDFSFDQPLFQNCLIVSFNCTEHNSHSFACGVSHLAECYKRGFFVDHLYVDSAPLGKWAWRLDEAAKAAQVTSWRNNYPWRPYLRYHRRRLE